MRGYDAWKTTDPADNELGRSNGQPTPWHCVNCAVNGSGVLAQAAHWRETQHMMRFGKRPLTSVCAWCDPKRETTDRLLAQGHNVTHGICDKHRAEFEAGRAFALPNEDRPSWRQPKY